MTTPSDRSTPRRDFIGQLAASAVVLASSACAAPSMASESIAAPTPAPRPSTPPTPTHWDDSWFARLTAKHKAVFDSPSVEDGAAMYHATAYISGLRDAVGAPLADVQTVIVIRHEAIPMAFNDAMWEKYDFGKEEKIKDDVTDKWAARNPFFLPAPPKGDAPARPAPPADRPQANLAWFAAHQTVLGCDRATRGFAQQLSSKRKMKMQDVYEELKANLIPGVILQPTGIYAVLRAQEAGCCSFRST